MNKNSFFKSLLFAFTIVCFVACDNDYNVLGTDIVGVDNFEFGTPITYQVKTTNVNTGVAESTNLPINPLGIYNNPVFGLTKANFVTQVQLASVDPTIDLTLAPEILDVVLNVPYFSERTGTGTDGKGIYKLDSIYGPDPVSKMKLSVYESGYFLRNINPVDQLTQAYYTDNADFESNIIGAPLYDSSTTTQNDDFVFSNIYTNKKTYTDSGTATETEAAPALNLNLSKEFFTAKIFNAPAGKLLNNNVFDDYFRGLYFKVENDGSEPGNLAMLNFKTGTITISYREQTSATNTAWVYKTMVLNLTGSTASLIEQGPAPVVSTPGEVVLKGGANNSMAVVDLFGPGELEQLKANNWLINDASLTFTIDKAKMSNAKEPLRVYLYDLNNRRPLIDYSADASTSPAKPKFDKLVFGGIIKRESGSGTVDERRGVSYKIRLTKHIIQMVKVDSTNVRLGLVVTEDIRTATNKRLKNTAAEGIKVIPTMSVLHPLGTILYGSDYPDVALRPKFEIYYTKPKQN